MESFVVPRVPALAEKIRLSAIDPVPMTGFEKKDERKDAFEHLQKAFVVS